MDRYEFNQSIMYNPIRSFWSTEARWRLNNSLIIFSTMGDPPLNRPRSTTSQLFFFSSTESTHLSTTKRQRDRHLQRHRHARPGCCSPNRWACGMLWVAITTQTPPFLRRTSSFSIVCACNHPRFEGAFIQQQKQKGENESCRANMTRCCSANSEAACWKQHPGDETNQHRLSKRVVVAGNNNCDINSAFTVGVSRTEVFVGSVALGPH